MEGGGVVAVIEGLAEAIAELHEMSSRAEDATPIMQEIGAGVASEMKMHLQAQQSQGGAMKALTPRYAARKAKRYPGKTILRATDQLIQSIAWEAGPDFVEAGPTDEKARYHASPEARHKMPLRDPFYVEDTDEAAEALADFIGPRP